MTVGGPRWEDRCLSHSPPPPDTHTPFPQSHHQRGSQVLGNPRGKSRVCLANCLRKLNNGFWGGEERNGERKVKSLPNLSQSRRESWGANKECRRPTKPGFLIPQQDPQTWPKASSGEGHPREVQREQRESRLASELETQPLSPQEPHPPEVPEPTTLLHLSRCPSYHSNHLLPLVSGNWPGVVHIPFPASWLHP